MKWFLNNKKVFQAILILGILPLFLSSSNCYAEDISFEATVDSNQVSLDSSFQLTLTVHGTQNASPVQLPTIDGFDSRYLGPSTHVSIINGQVSSAKSFIYNLYPQKVGQFTIPALSITIDGKTYSSAPIIMEVVAESSSPQGQNQLQAEQPTSLQDKIFLVINTPKKEAFLNEKIPLSIKLYVAGLKVRYSPQIELSHDGVAMDEFSKPKESQQVMGGVPYTVVEFNTNIYPTRTGDLTLGPAKMDVQVYVKSAQKHFPDTDNFGGIFDDEFFQGFLDHIEMRPLSLQSADLSIKVLSLPEEGQPRDFFGAVGKFDFQVSVSPQEVKVGDPLTLKMNVTGEGNLKTITMPSLKEQNGLKLYEPQIKEENGTKILEQVVIPTSDQITEIPALRFSYFDTATKSYQTIEHGPFPLKVKKLEPGEQLKVVGLEQKESASAQQEQLGRDIIFIKDYPGQFQSVGFHVYESFAFYLFIILSIMTLSALLFVYSWQNRLKSDIAYARKLQAPKKAKNGLAHAKHLLAKGDAKAFYDATFKTLQDYLGDKLHLPSGAITFPAVEDIFNSKSIDANIMGSLKAIFDECDMVRFASANFDAIRMRTTYQNLEKIIDYIERHWR